MIGPTFDVSAPVTPLDPVTFQPFVDAPVVELGLTYDPSPPRGVRKWVLGPWLLLFGGLAYFTNRLGG